MSNLDEIDRQLVALLQQDNRLSLNQLSAAIGAAPSTINDRLKRLERRGVLSGYHAHVNPGVIGLDLLAFVFVGWGDPKTEAAFLKRVAAAPEILECHHVTGAWNYLLKVRVTNTAALERLLAGTVKAVAGVQRTETLIALSTPKETWMLPVE